MSSTLEDKRQVPFAMVEKEVLKDPTVSAQAKALYALLICYGPTNIFPGQQRLADELGVSRPTVRKWLDELKEHDLVTWSTRQGKSHLYQILGPKYRHPVKETLQQPVKPADIPVNTSLQPPVKEALHDRDPEIDTQEDQEPTATPSQGDAPPPTLNAWLERLKEPNSNRVAILRWMLTVHFPDSDAPAYPKVGRVAKRLHAGRLAQLIWEHSGRRITGCPLDYIQAVANGKDNGKQRTNSAVQSEIGPQALAQLRAIT